MSKELTLDLIASRNDESATFLISAPKLTLKNRFFLSEPYHKEGLASPDSPADPALNTNVLLFAVKYSFPALTSLIAVITLIIVD